MTRRGLLAALALALAGAANPLAAQTLPPGLTPADRAEIQSTITRQLDAFGRDDAAAAWAFAAPSIQQMFQTPDRFLDMVRRAYPPVYRPRDRQFAELALRDGQLVQEVELIGPDGAPVLALYTMERDPAGTWRISGCTLVPSARLAA